MALFWARAVAEKGGRAPAAHSLPEPRPSNLHKSHKSGQAQTRVHFVAIHPSLNFMFERAMAMTDLSLELLAAVDVIRTPIPSTIPPINKNKSVGHPLGHQILGGCLSPPGLTPISHALTPTSTVLTKTPLWFP